MTFHFYLQDAHICSLDFDKSTSLFAVFDGHGGSEVALYCSKKLPEFLKNTDAYKKCEYEQALKDAFLGFDATLVDEETVKELKQLMPADKLDGETSGEDGDDDEEDLSELRQESRMPLEQLLEKLKETKNIPLVKLKQGEGSGAKPLSPYLRGRRNGPSIDESDQNGDSIAISKRQTDVDAAEKDEEEETVSSSSASAVIEKGQSANEPSSSSVTAGDASQIAGSTSDAHADNGPSSSSSGGASSSMKSDFANSPDSSSAANTKSENPTHTSTKLNKTTNIPESHVDGTENSSPLKKVETDDNGVKVESVSSSSTAENGAVVSSNEKVTQHTISSALEEAESDEDDEENDEDDEEDEAEGEDVDDDEDEEDENDDEEGELTKTHWRHFLSADEAINSDGL